jgi:hypothetical protein
VPGVEFEVPAPGAERRAVAELPLERRAEVVHLGHPVQPCLRRRVEFQLEEMEIGLL